MAVKTVGIVQSQYQGSNIETLVLNLQNVFHKHIKSVVDSFLNDIYNIETANSVGLECWGEILNFPRVIKGLTDGEFYTLQDDEYRTILLMKSIQMTSSLTIPQINEFLKRLFTDPYGVEAYIADNQNMSIVNYVFVWKIPNWLKAAFTNYQILPSPIGVGTGFIEALASPIGFEGQDLTNFYRAKFNSFESFYYTEIGFDGQNLGNLYQVIFKKIGD